MPHVCTTLFSMPAMLTHLRIYARFVVKPSLLTRGSPRLLGRDIPGVRCDGCGDRVSLRLFTAEEACCFPLLDWVTCT
jgi:hypothetical protein